MKIELKEKEQKMDEKKIARINELYHKMKAEGLTAAEKEEQQKLRREYIDSVRNNLKNTLKNVSIVEADGTITPVVKKEQ